jgi:hypothetical protein
MKALYYPDIEVRNPTILKNALLLWDSLETIVPNAAQNLPNVQHSREKQRAIDLVVRRRRPSNEERSQAHEALQKLLRSGQLAAIMGRAPKEWHGMQYLIYPDKFLHMTWAELEHRGLAQFNAASEDYAVPSVLGYLMMSLLADSCAGTQIQKITDRVDAYSWLAEAHANALGTTPVRGLDVSQVAPAYDRLVSISLDVLDARAVPLKKLVEFREREASSNSTDYTAMRRRYASTLDAHIKRVTTEAKTISDLKELERHFRDQLKHDVADLKSELGIASLKTLFSKEVAISTLIMAGSLATPIPGLTALSSQIGLLGIIPLLKSATELRGARRAALQKHTSSWLYLAKGPRFRLR